jgi:hypothetical protein
MSSKQRLIYFIHYDVRDGDGWGQKNERRTGTFCGGAEDERSGLAWRREATGQRTE